MKKIIFIGKTGSGKTTLCQNLHGEKLKYQKTQAVNYMEQAIDTPGEYIENRNYHHALIVIAADAEIIGLVQDCTEEESFFPPGFCTIFPKISIGIVTKVDLATEREDIDRAKLQLQLAGVTKTFEVSTITNSGIKTLVTYLENIKL